MAMRVSDFMVDLGKKLVADKGIAESSASLYIKNLWTLNGKQPFGNLAFLKNSDTIDGLLANYSDNTKKTYLSSIVSVLSLFKDKATYKKIYQHYYDAMMSKATDMKKEETDEKTVKQKDNWMEWTAVEKIAGDLHEEVNKFVGNKLITPAQYNKLLSHLILSLYTTIAPRRNADYSEMFVVGKWNDKMDTNKNYLDMAAKKMIFNKYKTAKKYGQQIVELAEVPKLWEAITMYLKHSPLHKGKMAKNTEFRFLTYEDGSPLSAVNSITRVLNKTLGKKVGSSMLRHIFLSNKYDIKDMKDTAEEMGHSVNEALKYAKE
jgi:hypothetical protein